MDEALRVDLLDGLRQAMAIPGTNEDIVHLVTGDLTWLISRDARVAVGVRRTREADGWLPVPATPIQVMTQP